MAFVLFVCVNGFAQDGTTLKEVVISAPKFQEKLSRTGKVVTVIDSAQLAEAGSRNLLELIQLQAGIQAVGTRSAWGANQELYVRGSGTGQVLVLLDGFPLNDPSHISRVFDWNLLDISQFERIEILKGGHSTLYGSDAMAGVINLVSKSTSQKKFSGSISMNGGNFGLVNPVVQLSSKVKSNQFTFLGSHLGVKGFSSAAVQNGEADGFGRNLLSVGWRKKWKEKLEWSSQVRWSNYKGNLDAGPFVDDKDYTSEAHALSVHGQLVYHLSTTDLQLRVFSDFSSRRFLDDSTDVSANAYTSYYFANYAGWSQGLEWFGKTRWKGAELVYGMEYRQQKASQSDFYYGFGYGYSSPEIKADGANQSIYAGFLAAQKEWGRFGLEVGGRFNSQSTFGRFGTYSVNAFYRFTDKWKLFGNVYSGFKVPTLYQLYSAYGNLSLLPEKGETVEIGLQYKSGWEFLRLVYFNNRVKDGIGFQSKNEAPYGQYFNIGAQGSNGIEAEVQTKLGPIKVSGNYTYLEGFSEIKESGGLVRKDFLVRRPRHQWSIRGEGSISDRLTVSAVYQVVGSRIDLVYDESTYSTVQKELAAYNWLEISLGYKWNERVGLRLSGRNLLNQSFSEQYGYNGMPFVLQGGVKVGF